MSANVGGFGDSWLFCVSDAFSVGSWVDDFFAFLATGVSDSGLVGGKNLMAIKPRQAPMVSTLVMMAAWDQVRLREDARFAAGRVIF